MSVRLAASPSLCLAAVLSLWPGLDARAHAILMHEDFEDAEVLYTAGPDGEYSDGQGDFFTRTDGTNIGSFIEVDGVEGDSWFHAMDLDGDARAPAQTLTFSNINISGFLELGFAARFAEDDDGDNEDWDIDDFVHVRYRIDGGPMHNLLWIENDGTLFNTAPRVDTDFDGNGDGPLITDSFKRLTAAIPHSGETLELSIRFVLGGDQEDLALDDVMVFNGIVPQPATCLYAVPIAASLATARRRRPGLDAALETAGPRTNTRGVGPGNRRGILTP